MPRATDTGGWDEPLTNLSGAVLPNGTITGPVAVDTLLSEVLASDGRGLLLMGSSRQGRDEFSSAARMLSLGGHVLPTSALLLVCNNASVGRGSLLQWLRDFPVPPLKMLGQTRNFGYFCGNLHSLAATASIWMRFPWVLHMSGPDTLLTPNGARLLTKLIEEAPRPVGARGQTQMRRRPLGSREFAATAYLGDRFPSPRGHARFSMDLFVFWPRQLLLPARKTTQWSEATRWCLHGFGPSDESAGPDVALHPEVLLNEMRLRFNLSFRRIPGGHGPFRRGERRAEAARERARARSLLPSRWRAEAAHGRARARSPRLRATCSTRRASSPPALRLGACPSLPTRT